MFNYSSLEFADKKFYLHLTILALSTLLLFLTSLFSFSLTVTLSNLLLFGLSSYLIISSLYTKYVSKYLFLPVISFIFAIICVVQCTYVFITPFDSSSLPPFSIILKSYYVGRISFAVSLVIITYYFIKKSHKIFHGLVLCIGFFLLVFWGSFLISSSSFFAFIHSHTLAALVFNLLNHLIVPAALLFAFFHLYPIRTQLPTHYIRVLVLFAIVCSVKEAVDMLYFEPFATPGIVTILFNFVALGILTISQIDTCILRPVQTLHTKNTETQQLANERTQSLTHYSQHVQKLESVVKNQFTSYQKLISIFPEPCLICIGSTIYQLNPAAMKLFASSTPHSLIGTDLLAHIENGSSLKSDFENLTKQPGTLLEGESKLLLPHGKSYPIEYVFTANTLNTSESVLCILRNVSSKYETKSTKQALQRQQLRLRYFSSLSHDIKTPINIIYSALQMQSHAATLPECTHYTEMMHTSCLKLLKLLNNLLDLTKIDNQMFSLKHQHFNIVDAVETLCEVSSHYIKSKGLTYLFDTELDEKFVYLDPTILERIILNLLSNAIKYTPTGGQLFINLTFTEDQTSIHIKDTGSGIPDEKLAMIFNSYTTLDSNCNIEHSSGLGLSIVSDLLNLLGGTITCTSELHKGSEFIITLNTPSLEINEPTDGYHLSSTAQNIKIEFCDI